MEETAAGADKVVGLGESEFAGTANRVELATAEAAGETDRAVDEAAVVAVSRVELAMAEAAGIAAGAMRWASLVAENDEAFNTVVPEAANAGGAEARTSNTKMLTRNAGKRRTVVPPPRLKGASTPRCAP